MLNDSVVDLTHPTGVSAQQLAHRDARDTDMRLIGRGELAVTVRADPTCHAADCAAATSANDQASWS